MGISIIAKIGSIVKEAHQIPLSLKTNNLIMSEDKYDKDIIKLEIFALEPINKIIKGKKEIKRIKLTQQQKQEAFKELGALNIEGSYKIASLTRNIRRFDGLIMNQAIRDKNNRLIGSFGYSYLFSKPKEKDILFWEYGYLIKRARGLRLGRKVIAEQIANLKKTFPTLRIKVNKLGVDPASKASQSIFGVPSRRLTVKNVKKIIDPK